MSNTYFKFKRFTIAQENCAMKVCTDACIQGAYTAARLKQQMEDGDAPSKKIRRILDIGTGTGLLSLMLAQEIPEACIDAVELDHAACLQAKENFAHAAHPESLRIFRGDIRTYVLPGRYDFIISNPPFYERDLKSDHRLKSQAKHSTTLHYEGLMQVMDRYLSAAGSFCVMFPVRQFDSFRALAGLYGYFPELLLSVQHSPEHADFRSIGYFKRGRQALKQDRLCITNGSGEYTLAFKRLLQEYYLYL